MPALTVAPSMPSTLRDLPALLNSHDGWPALVDALRDRQSGSLGGAWGSSVSLAIASLAEAAPSSVLVVVPHAGDLDGWAADLLGFTGEAPVVLPAWETWPPSGSPADPVAGDRLRILRQLTHDSPTVLLTTPAALMQPVPSPGEMAGRSHPVRIGASLDSEDFAHWLVDHGYRRVEAVEFRGDFAIRGGIVDVFSPDAEFPIRLELFGDEVESLRHFSTETQRSLESTEAVTILALTGSSDAPESSAFVHFTEHLPRDAWVVLVEPVELTERAKLFLERVSDRTGLYQVESSFAALMRFPNVTVTALPTTSVETTCHLHVESVERFSGRVEHVAEELDAIALKERVLIACPTEAERHRLEEVLATGKLASSGRLGLTSGSVRAGFRLLNGDGGFVVLGSHDLFHRAADPLSTRSTAGATPGRRIESRAIDSFLDLNEGDYVVHVAQGIAIYRGMRMLPKGATSEAEIASATGTALEENLILEFRGGVRVYVPASKIDLIQKYVGGKNTAPELSKFGGTAWGRKKAKVEEAVRDMAADMLQLQAVRAAQPGFAYPPDTDWQREFEDSFPYQETPDQLTAVSEILGDMRKHRPMDRLLCGDVGYGKTELAIRAAFKAIDNGKQVAVLVPTTVLAEQHFRTFTERLAAYPFVVECLNRFRTGKTQKEIVRRLATGGVDVIIGTHRIISKDVIFKDLGLVIIDEEQRFGVEHKERLKRLRVEVDVLTMTATPIPRTLHQSLLGIRDISSLETPPADRLPVETRIVRWDAELIRNAILRELNRGGQVYFVHNRVHDIHAVAQKLETIVPEARFVVGHGQMSADELEQAMVSFVRREADVLVATTIIESGLDIPNANTIFIDQADIYGLAEMHQLRGRVGRTKIRAYAYLLLDDGKMVSEVAAKRLKAIEEYSQLGSGFKIAMRDLEIRGAGNLLGSEQSGHIAALGYEMYCQLLDNAVRTLQKKPLRKPVEVNIDLPWPAFLPRDYVPSQKLRIEVYRRLSRIRDPRKLADFRDELRDRYGEPPETAEWLLRLTEIRLLASKWQVAMIHRDGKDLVLNYRSRQRMKELGERAGKRFRIVDEKAAYYRIEPGDEEPEKTYPLLRSLLRPRDEMLSGR